MKVMTLDEAIRTGMLEQENFVDPAEILGKDVLCRKVTIPAEMTGYHKNQFFTGERCIYQLALGLDDAPYTAVGPISRQKITLEGMTGFKNTQEIFDLAMSTMSNPECGVKTRAMNHHDWLKLYDSGIVQNFRNEYFLCHTECGKSGNTENLFYSVRLSCFNYRRCVVDQKPHGFYDYNLYIKRTDGTTSEIVTSASLRPVIQLPGTIMCDFSNNHDGSCKEKAVRLFSV